MIIGQEAIRNLSTKSTTGNEEFSCGTIDDVKTIELYDGSGNIIENLKPAQVALDPLVPKGTKIKFTIKNQTNHK